MNRIVVWTVAGALFGAVAGCGGASDGPEHAREPESLVDTEENRRAQAERYMLAVPSEEMFRDMADNMVGAFPGTDAAAFEVAVAEIDLEAFDKILIETMGRHFTADELRALADFYGSPVGKSAMSKFGEYMGDAMPLVQEQFAPAMEKMMADER